MAPNTMQSRAWSKEFPILETNLIYLKTVEETLRKTNETKFDVSHAHALTKKQAQTYLRSMQATTQVDFVNTTDVGFSSDSFVGVNNQSLQAAGATVLYTVVKYAIQDPRFNNVAQMFFKETGSIASYVFKKFTSKSTRVGLEDISNAVALPFATQDQTVIKSILYVVMNVANSLGITVDNATDLQNVFTIIKEPQIICSVMTFLVAVTMNLGTKLEAIDNYGVQTLAPEPTSALAVMHSEGYLSGPIQPGIAGYDGFTFDTGNLFMTHNPFSSSAVSAMQQNPVLYSANQAIIGAQLDALLVYPKLTNFGNNFLNMLSEKDETRAITTALSKFDLSNAGTYAHIAVARADPSVANNFPQVEKDFISMVGQRVDNDARNAVNLVQTSLQIVTRNSPKELAAIKILKKLSSCPKNYLENLAKNMAKKAPWLQQQKFLSLLELTQKNMIFDAKQKALELIRQKPPTTPALLTAASKFKDNINTNVVARGDGFVMLKSLVSDETVSDWNKISSPQFSKDMRKAGFDKEQTRQYVKDKLKILSPAQIKELKTQHGIDLRRATLKAFLESTSNSGLSEKNSYSDTEIDQYSTQRGVVMIKEFSDTIFEKISNIKTQPETATSVTIILKSAQRAKDNLTLQEKVFLKDQYNIYADEVYAKAYYKFYELQEESSKIVELSAADDTLLSVNPLASNKFTPVGIDKNDTPLSLPTDVFDIEKTEMVLETAEKGPELAKELKQPLALATDTCEKIDENITKADLQNKEFNGVKIKDIKPTYYEEFKAKLGFGEEPLPQYGPAEATAFESFKQSLDDQYEKAAQAAENYKLRYFSAATVALLGFKATLFSMFDQDLAKTRAGQRMTLKAKQCTDLYNKALTDIMNLPDQCDLPQDSPQPKVVFQSSNSDWVRANSSNTTASENVTVDQNNQPNDPPPPNNQENGFSYTYIINTALTLATTIIGFLPPYETLKSGAVTLYGMASEAAGQIITRASPYVLSATGYAKEIVLNALYSVTPFKFFEGAVPKPDIIRTTYDTFINYFSTTSSSLAYSTIDVPVCEASEYGRLLANLEYLSQVGYIVSLGVAGVITIALSYKAFKTIQKTYQCARKEYKQFKKAPVKYLKGIRDKTKKAYLVQNMENIHYSTKVFKFLHKFKPDNQIFI